MRTSTCWPCCDTLNEIRCLPICVNVRRAGSLWRRTSGSAESCELLSELPVPQRRTWVAMVNRVQNASEGKAIRKCLKKGQPYGIDLFVSQSAAGGRVARRDGPLTLHLPDLWDSATTKLALLEGELRLRICECSYPGAIDETGEEWYQVF